MADASFCVSDEIKEYLWNGTYSKVASVQGTHQADKQMILDRVFRSLSEPPCFTVVRVKLSKMSLDQAKMSLETFLRQEYKDKSMPCPEVLTHQHVPDILLVSTQGVDETLDIVEKQVIVGCQCGSAVLRGANVFAPGVLAASAAMQRGDLVSVFSDVNGECRRGLTKPFEGTKIFVGNGVTNMARKEIFCAEKCPSGLAIRMTQPLYDSPGLNGFLPDVIFLQNLPSVVTSHVLGPRPGERILDMCAAPGGKTTHIAQIMEDKGVVFALDKSKPKIAKILSNMKKLNITCIRPFLWDATKAVRGGESQDSEADSPPFPRGSFDRILLDGPCSALGQRPQQSFKKTNKELQSFPIYQKKLLTAAEQLLKPGGTLVYSTCTICSEENEQQVAWALGKFPSLELVAQDIHIGGTGMRNCGLTEEQSLLVQRFDPLDVDSVKDRQRLPTDCDTIGFFIAKFVKKMD